MGTDKNTVDPREEKGDNLTSEEDVYRAVLVLIRKSLWNDPTPVTVNWAVFEEMKRHALIALPAGILPVLDMPDGLRQIWKTEIYQQIAYNINIRCAEAELPILVPYVILKGTAAAKYYPHPEYRTMGDIDVMTSRENFDTAFNQLIQKGYKPVNDLYREPGFMKDGIKVELHRSFALLNDVGQAESLDNLIMKNINSTHFLPDNINGLVILEHISQHLEQGIGWRQIIDWMMFADHFLSDDHWPDFEDMAKSIGLRELAVHVTRMCEIYLGLLSRKWCSNADEGICHRLMVYVFQCGNFGTKRETNKGKTERVINYSRTPIAALKNLQKNGLVNWKMAQKYSILRPFAWIYQACRYIRKGLMHKNAIGDLREAYHEAKQQGELFDKLGVRQRYKGTSKFVKGEYKKV